MSCTKNLTIVRLCFACPSRISLGAALNGLRCRPNERARKAFNLIVRFYSLQQDLGILSKCEIGEDRRRVCASYSRYELLRHVARVVVEVSMQANHAASALRWAKLPDCSSLHKCPVFQLQLEFLLRNAY